MGGFHHFEGSDRAGVSCKAVYPLTHEDVISMLKNENENDRIPLPLEEEIQDRSKSDWLAKMIAFLQTLWFVMQCIARKIENLPTTQLEIVTLAYAAINLGMFIAWWDKPRNVDRPIRVFHTPVEEGERKKLSWFARTVKEMKDGQIDLHSRKKVPMLYSGRLEIWEMYTAVGIFLAAGVVFGAIHCIAWSFHFPSHTELVLWRVSSVTITAIPASFLPFQPGMYQLSKIRMKKHLPKTTASLIQQCSVQVLVVLVYLSARIITLVLAFMNLTSLPPAAFQSVHWMRFISHL
jgi:hypothetical protein